MINQKLIEIIKDITVTSSFTSCNYTINQKLLMCEAFSQITSQFPQEMTEYFQGSRKYNMQNKIFKAYLSILEKSLPISFHKGKEKFTIRSLTDKNLNIFSEIQEFEQFVDNNLKIKNNTSQIYIGGRKASYVKPYFIGKVLEVVDLSNNQSILGKVNDYTFTHLKMEKIAPGTKVKVTHLAVPPHYQMGPMVYLNRLRSEIKSKL